MFAFCLAETPLYALPSGALYWQDQALLCVSDLHFGKSERMARRGGALLPPYETRATLQRLDDDLAATRAQQVICLGDSFDDLATAEGLDLDDQLWLTRLMAGRNWIWIEGNHDAGPVEMGGSHRADLRLGQLQFRHIATAETPEISGHYHPKARLSGRSHRCFLLDKQRLILPAYGTYTGGLWSHDSVLCDLMQPDALALVLAKSVLAMPMPRQGRPS